MSSVRVLWTDNVAPCINDNCDFHHASFLIRRVTLVEMGVEFNLELSFLLILGQPLDNGMRSVLETGGDEHGATDRL